MSIRNPSMPTPGSWQDRSWRCVGIVLMALILRFIGLPFLTYAFEPHPGCVDDDRGQCDDTRIP